MAGAARVDITPAGSVWMDGMIRDRRSEGVHDPLYARAVALGDDAPAGLWVLVTVDVCALDEATTGAVRSRAQEKTGIPAAQIVIAATHTHAGPSAYGIFTPRETGWVEELVGRLVEVIGAAARNARPALPSAGSGVESTISHYRRLMADDGHVVMNWEPWPPERIIAPLGTPDTEVGVLRLVSAGNPAELIAQLFNHAGHPNILSGANLLLSSEYPGLAARVLEEQAGGTALFFNGAQGSVDIDGLRHRDWEGCERAGKALAQAVTATKGEDVRACARGATTRYELPGRALTDAEWAWAQDVLARTGGSVTPMADGVGDDYKAVLYRMLHDQGARPLAVEQACIAVGSCALLTFPGELYTEIGKAIKLQSPFALTFIIGLANGYTGYIPTETAVKQGGYAEETRRCAAAAERVAVEKSLELLERVHRVMEEERNGDKDGDFGDSRRPADAEAQRLQELAGDNGG